MLAAVPPPGDRIPPEIITADDLFAEEFEPVVWTVPDLLQRGSCDLLAGKAKMGKSRLALALGWSISIGEPALGAIPVIAGDVLYLSLEDGQRRLQARLFQLTGADPDDAATWPRNPRFHTSSEWSPLDDGGLDFIRQWIAQVPNPTLVIIDTLMRVKPETNGKKPLYDTDYDVLKPLTDLAHETNVGILVVHHTRKADAEDWLDLVQGSTGTTAATDGTMILQRKRGSKNATLLRTHRDALTEVQIALVSNDVTGGWEFNGNAEENNAADTRDAILSCLIALGDPQKPAEIAGAIGRPANVVSQRLFAMYKEGLVRRTKYACYVASDSAIEAFRRKTVKP